MGATVVTLRVEEVSTDPDRAKAYEIPWRHLRSMLRTFGVSPPDTFDDYLDTVTNVYEQEKWAGEPPYQGDTFEYNFPEFAGMCWVEAAMCEHWFHSGRLVAREHPPFYGIRFAQPQLAVPDDRRFIVLRGQYWVDQDDELCGTGPTGPVDLPVAELSSSEQAEVEAWRADGRCWCPVCEAIRPGESGRAKLLAETDYDVQNAWFPILSEYDPAFVEQWLVTRDRKYAFLGNMLGAVEEAIARSPALVDGLVGFADHEHDHVRAASMLAQHARGFDARGDRARMLTQGVEHGPLCTFAALHLVEDHGLETPFLSSFLEAVASRLGKRLLASLRVQLVVKTAEAIVNTLRLGTVPASIHGAMSAWAKSASWVPAEIEALRKLPTGDPAPMPVPDRPVPSPKRARRKKRTAAPEAPTVNYEALASAALKRGDAPGAYEALFDAGSYEDPRLVELGAQLAEMEQAVRGKKLGKTTEFAVERKGEEWQWISQSVLAPLAKPVLAMSLGRTPPTKTALRSLASFPALRELGMYSAGLPDDTLEWVAGTERLRKLDLRADRFSDDGLSHIRSLSKLRVLYLQGSTHAALTEAGYASIAELTRLELLGVWGLTMTDSSLVRICDHLRELRTLRLAHCSFSDDGLRGLHQLPLRHLSLSVVGLSSAAMEPIVALDQLTSLNLQGNWVDAGCIDRLADSAAPIGELVLSSCALKLEDLDPLIDLPDLRTLRVRGLNLDADVVRDRFPQLTEVEV